MPRSQRISLRHSISGWRSLIATSDAAVTRMALARAAKVACEGQHTEGEGARVYVVTPSNTNTDHKRVFLDIHGGGFIMGSGGASGSIRSRATSSGNSAADSLPLTSHIFVMHS